MSRDFLARFALADLPKLLTLQDRNPHSPTYGCFDRNYWQYRLLDFPTGMAQEFVWPLALAWHLPLPENPYRGQAAIRDWIIAGLAFAQSSAHKDGACDDFFPYERAAGATAFSLLACLEASSLVDYREAGFEAFLNRRGKWLGHHQESGKLSNHEALIVLCLDLLSERTRDHTFSQLRDARLKRLLSWQDKEGWFWEYEGCDLGYQTLTLSLLAWLDQRRPELNLRNVLIRGAKMVTEFVHPDGSFGGEYFSRNTYNYFPYGLELIGRYFPDALMANDRVIAGRVAGRGACYSDDHMIGHHLWNWLLTWKDWVPSRPHPVEQQPQMRNYYPSAGLLMDRQGDTALYLATNKGGVFKLFRNKSLVASDTQISFRMKDGRTAVCHMVDRYQVEITTDKIVISGEAGWAKQRLMGIFDNILLRVFMVTIGRFFSDLVRRLLQGILITGKTRAPFKFRRELHRQEGKWRVVDEIASDAWSAVESVGLGGHQTSIFVIQSRTFQPGQMQSHWQDLTQEITKLKPGATLKIEREI
ncbi:MAG: hypothetical protein R3E60_00850 [Alphaproteobacteria bacterium]